MTEDMTYVISCQHAVDELQHTNHDQKRKESVNQQHPMGRMREIAIPEIVENGDGICSRGTFDA